MDDKATAKTSPKDVFLHLLSIITLYFSTGSFIALLFQYINVLLPEFTDQGYFALSNAYNIIRWSISSLIVVFPSYLLTVRYLNKGYEKNPFKRQLAIRKWLTYLTLFVAALIIIGDLVTLINHLLMGESTLRFLLKVLAVFLSIGSVFTYYFWDLKKSKIE